MSATRRPADQHQMTLPIDAQANADKPAQTTTPATEDISYLCSQCEGDLTYQVVHHTGRCPACGSGLRRTDTPPTSA